MKRNFRFSIWTILTLFVLAANAVHPQVAYADDGTPPPDATETAAPTEDISTPQPVEQATETPTPVLTDATEDISTPQPAEQATETPTPIPTTEDAPPVDETPIVALLPENTDLIVLDEDGAPLPLATQQAADAIVIGDPIWCPTGAAPTPGSNGCTGSYTNLYNLIAAITNSNISQPSADGTIWITNGIDTSSGKITIDGSALTTWTNYSLTIQGGWNGVSGDTTISGSSIFNDALEIINWSGAVTLNDLTFRNTGDANASLSVETQGDIQVSNVTARNNSSGDGANLISNSNDISIQDSTFSNNNHNGLHANGENVTLINVTARSNGNSGAELMSNDADGGISITGGSFNNNNDIGADLLSNGNISIVGNAVFTGNGGEGLSATADGSITLKDVAAKNNAAAGADVNAAGNISVTGSSFNDNGEEGLSATAGGSITLKDVAAKNNAAAGADVNADGNISVTGSSFNDNGEEGLSAKVRGSITLKDVAARNNTIYGAYLTAAGNVRITDSFFNNNVNATGLYVDSKDGFIELVNVEAVKNRDKTGASLSAQQNVTVTGGLFNNNGEIGLGAVSDSGSITLNGVTAERNNAGVELFSYQNVTISGGSFSHNQDSGLFIIAVSGSLTLSNVTADDNDDDSSSFGALLYAEQDADISDSSFSGNSNGLFAASNSGSIVFSNITVEDNDISGASLFAYQDATVAGGSFGGNGGEGLHVQADNGWIALSNVTASENGDNGATLLASGSSGNNITVSNSAFNNNDAAGLNAYSDGLGSIYLENVTANNNLGVCMECDGFGTSLETNGGSIAVLNGSFSGNGQNGIFVPNSGGADVTISCAHIENNDGYGVQVSASATPLALELNGAIFSGNGGGDYANANGTVVINTDCAPITPTPTAPITPTPTAPITPTPTAPITPTPTAPINTGSSEANSGSGISLLPWRIIPVKAEENERKFGLDCVAYRGSILALSNFDFIALPCPIGEQASFEHINQAALPAPLEDDLTFVAALNGKVYEALEGTMRVGFFIPTEKQNASYAILHWDGSKWTNLKGAFVHDNNYVKSALAAYPDFFDFIPQDTDGFFVTASTRDGVFVLVTK